MSTSDTLRVFFFVFGEDMLKSVCEFVKSECVYLSELWLSVCLNTHAR